MPETTIAAEVRQLPRPPEKTKTIEADGLHQRTETLFKDSQARTQPPAWWMREADVQHQDPTKKLIATQDTASNTTFLVESYPIEGSREDRYVLIKWEKTDPDRPGQKIPGGWIRLVQEKDKDPYLGLARYTDETFDGILPHVNYIGNPGGIYRLGEHEIKELSAEALQSVLTRLNNSQVSAELTEKYWQLAEADRLNEERVNVSVNLYRGTFWALDDHDRWKIWEKAAAYEHELDMLYVQFCEKYNLPHRNRKPIWIPQPDRKLTKAEIDEEIAKATAWHAAHPADQKDAQTQKNAADFAKWLGKEGKQVLSGVTIPQEMTQAGEQNTTIDKQSEKQESEALQIQEAQLLLKEEELLAEIDTWKKQRNPNSNVELDKALEDELQALPYTLELKTVRAKLRLLREQTQQVP